MGLYQESPTSTYTHNNRKFNLNKLFFLVQNRNVSRVNVSEVSSDLKRAKITLDNGEIVCRSCYLRKRETHQERVNNSDLNIPILVTKWDNETVVVDGVHRLEKAMSQGQTELLAIRLTKEDMLQAEIT